MLWLYNASVVSVGIVGVELPGTVEVRCSRLCFKDVELEAADGTAWSDEDGRGVDAELDGCGQGSRRQQKGWLCSLVDAECEILMMSTFSGHLRCLVSVAITCEPHHHSSDDCLEGKRENYQVFSVQYCVQQLCTVQCTHAHIWTDLTVVCWLDLAFLWLYCVLQFICVRFSFLGLFCVTVCVCVLLLC